MLTTMDEYEVSCVRVEKISTAVQSIKESLTCRICLELFCEPVTIKCGHKFCRDCILKVTNNENSSCPFCNTKIYKRSIPKECNTVLQASVKQFNNLVKAIQIDSGIDVLQTYNNKKNTREGSLEYNKPNKPKFENTPSTSKESFSITNRNLNKPKAANSIRSKLSLTKKKTDVKSSNESCEKNTLHKYLSNKSDPGSEQVVHSQEKVKYWLESCTSEFNNSTLKESVHSPSTEIKDRFNNDQISTTLNQIFCSPQEGEIKESDTSPVPPSETCSGSKYKEIQMRIQEAESMAKKKKISLTLKEKNNIETPSSVSLTSHSDAYDWRRVKQVGREMKVKTFKTLNVSIEKSSPSVVLDDTVFYNSTNNESRNISGDSDINNSSVNKAPLQKKKCRPLKSGNNNIPKKSPQIEECNHQSMDLIGFAKQENVTGFNIDEDQLNVIIGVVPTNSVAKVPEKTKTSFNSVNAFDVKSKLNNSTSLKRKSNSGQESTDDESTNSNRIATIGLKSSLEKKNRLSLNSLKDVANSKNSSPSTLDKTNEKEQKLNDYPVEKYKSRLSLRSLHDQNNSITHKLAPTKSSTDNLADKHSSSLSSGCHIIFKKLGKICKKKKNVPFLYLGRLEKEKCLYFDNNPNRKSKVVMKSIIPVCIDYKHLMQNERTANLRELSDEFHSEIGLHKSNLQLPTKYSSTNNHEEAMNMEEKVDVHRPGQLNEQMEIDESLPPVKMMVKNNNVTKINSERKMDLENKKDDLFLKSYKKSFLTKNFEKISQIDENVLEPFKSIDEDNTLKRYKTELANYNLFPESSSNVDKAKKESYSVQSKSTDEKNLNKAELDKLLYDLISNSSDDSEEKLHRIESVQEVAKVQYNKSCRKIRQKINVKSGLESCTESEVSAKSEIGGIENIEDAKRMCSSTSGSSLRNIVKKKRTHSESSNDDDDVDTIIDKWLDSDKDQITKKAKLSEDSEEMINKNASKIKHRSKYSFSSSSEDNQEETFKENKYIDKSSIDTIQKVKNHSRDINVNKLTAVPSSILSADLFESNEQSIQPFVQSSEKQFCGNDRKTTSAIDSDAQSDKENINERSRKNITVIDTRQLKRRKSSPTNTDNDDKENNKYKHTADYNKSIKITDEHVDEIVCMQKETNKAVNDFENESDPYFMRESLLNITQEQLACKNIEKDLLGVDLSKVQENQNAAPLDSDKFSTPHRKPKRAQETDDFDSDNVEATPVAKRRHRIRISSSQSSPRSEINASDMSSPEKKICLIPAITPMKNTRSYPLCHSTPMISIDSPANPIHSQFENIKVVCSSLSLEHTKLVQQFADKFNVQFDGNFDKNVTHVVVRVDPQTKAGPKTFKYIQGIAFKKYVVSFEWISDCLAKNKLLDADDEKYDVLDPDILESGSKKSRLSSQKLFKNFVFYCLEPFQKVSFSEFEELLIYNGAAIAKSIEELYLHKDRLKVIIVGSDDMNDECFATLSKAEAAAVYFEWVVDSLSQFQILSLPSYLCETTVDKAKNLGFPPDLLIEEETLEGEEYEDDD